jgi:hypothetical protein
MSTDVLEGLDAPETELGTDPPEAPEPRVDPAPEPDKLAQARAGDGKFKGKEGEAKPPERAADPQPERKSIPLAAHLEEKNRWERRATETEQSLKAMRAELEALKNPPKPPPAEPEFTADPKGYVDTKLGAALKQLETGTKEATTRAERAEQSAEAARFFQHLNQTEQAFIAQQPDYVEALNHLRGIRVQELVTLNPSLTEQQVKQILQNEEIQLAANLLREGRNPHEVAFTLAKTRGYTPKAPPPANGAGNVLPHVPTQKQLPPDQTLGTSAGSPDASGESFLNDDEVFDKAFNEMFGRKRA